MRMKTRVDPQALREATEEGTLAPDTSASIEQWTAALIDALQQILDQEPVPVLNQSDHYMYD